MIRYLMDSDCMIYALEATYPELRLRLALCKPGEVALSAITFSEILLGSLNDKPPTPEDLKIFTKIIPILPFDEAAAREYAKLPFKRARFDRLLAAHALSIGAIVVANNEADFADVPGLKVENWTVE